MNPFQLGFRNLFGILLPGAVLALGISACLAILFPGLAQSVVKQTANNAALLVAGFLLAAYILGFVIRLYAADTVDRLSASLVRIRRDPFEGKEGSIEDHLNDLLDSVANPDLPCDPSQDLIRWAWKYDEFPYPVWELMKFRLYHPDELFRFFFPYRRCFATGHRRGKEFFNYCKAVVYEAHEGKPHTLAEEIQGSEANVRFLAGIFWALLLSAILLTISAVTRARLLMQVGAFPVVTAGALAFFAFAAIVGRRTERLAREKLRVASFWIFNTMAVTLLFVSVWIGARRPELATETRMNVVALVMVLVAFSIVARGRFRLSRLKEVDSVFDAFFLVHRHAAECSRCRAGQESDPGLYEERRRLIQDAFAEGLSLESLVKLMKSRSAGTPRLSSLYFAGADRDHPYFVHTDKVAIGLSVLPEDEPKSSEAKRHPHQHEVVVVLDGGIRVEVAKDGQWLASDLSAGEVKTIYPDECHRILARGQDAVFLFVKTVPAEEPRGVSCTP